MRRRAILLTVRRDNREMEELAYSLGYDIAGVVLQNRPHPDAETFLGRGKLEEARALARAAGVPTILVNGSLKPGQVFSLIRFFRDGAERRPRPDRSEEAPWIDPEEVDVLDRTRVILDIFHERAGSPEARLQVELARLTYEIPLVKEAIHLLKRGERPGFLAGGSYEVDQYHDLIKRRMAKIRAELERLRREREVRRKHRRRSGFDLVSLAGYTNAGKSSLIQVLAGERTLVENRYFSTLGTLTRRMRGERREILVTDTVGFIEDLPPWLVEAFHSTLEEIALADLILLVVDASDPLPEMSRKLKSSLHVLWEHQEPRGAQGMRLAPTPILVVFNKTDLVSEEDLASRIGGLQAEGLVDESYVAVSAERREGIAQLQEAIRKALPGLVPFTARLPPHPEQEKVLALLHADANPVSPARWEEDGTVEVDLEARYSVLSTLLARIDEAGGSWRKGGSNDEGGPPSPSLRVEEQRSEETEEEKMG